ncbi:Arginine dihydrolase ArgZ-like C-terminal second subdomain domain-containing protein [Candidatus Magnetomoraceae bacterium gMMP-15]
MSFNLPTYTPPDFKTNFKDSPVVVFKKITQQGVAPEDYHATSVYPEYFQIKKGEWCLLSKSRMDCVVVLEKDDSLNAKEFRNLKKGELVACGRGENGEHGIVVHTKGFDFPNYIPEKFAFRTLMTRETSFSIDYDELYNLMEHEHENGFIVWVLGPAVVFDHDTREAFIKLIKRGYVHGLLAGNALATHDVEGAVFKTALGQELYSKKTVSMGHYRHLDALNKVREIGSIKKAINKGIVNDGIMRAVIEKNIPYVLAGSIRDDGPMPEVISDVYKAQNKMRSLTEQATTVIALATQLHAIATGNMTPSYHVMKNNQVRPVYFYSVDMSEFAINKLTNRGSLTARSILTNVQDFVVTLERGIN